MTAEVAILNKSAIAVAADSAVTVGENKVHRSANKIFAICDTSPIGLMINGFAEHCGIPWETIVKLFRSEHGKAKYRTVEECYDKFRVFLADKRFFMDESSALNLGLFAISAIGRVRRRAGKLPARGRTAILKKIIERQTDYFDKLQAKLNYNAPLYKDFRLHASVIINAAIDQVFEDDGYKVAAQLRTPIVKMIHHAISSGYVSGYASGVIVFGFGEEEIMPSLVSHDIDGSSFGSIRSVEHVTHTVGHGRAEDATIIPFADRNTMDVFIEDVSRDTKSQSGDFIRDCRVFGA
jgi:hypothetical protein